jgi:CRISPR-associated protein Cas2
MRLLIFFDLPMETAKDRKIYSKFRKNLINEGFIMLQESVYAKLVLNNSIANSEKEKIYKNRPPKGIVQMLLITEKQFSSIEYVVGKNNSSILDNTERLIIL